MNLARQREAQALREQYERKRQEEEASMRQLKDQSLQHQQEVANRCELANIFCGIVRWVDCMCCFACIFYGVAKCFD